MKAAVFYGKGDIRYEEREVKEPGFKEVMIHVKAAGICGTDMHIYEGAKGATECQPPVVLGHEFAGEVCKVGEGVTRVKPGDMVTVDPSLMCEACDPCRNGTPHFCEHYEATGVNYDGGFAEYCTVLEKQVYRLPEDTSYEEAAMCEPVGCCVHGIRLADIKMGDTVLVIGAGPIGCIMLQLARLAGAGTVIVSEPMESKRKMALQLGADYVVNPLDGAPEDALKELNVGKIHVAIECVGRPETMLDAIRLAGQGGMVLLFGLTEPDCEIPVKPFELFSKELTIRASYVNPYSHGKAADLIAKKKIRLKELISDRYELKDVGKAFSQKQRNGKCIIIP